MSLSKPIIKRYFLMDKNYEIAQISKDGNVTMGALHNGSIFEKISTANKQLKFILRKYNIQLEATASVFGYCEDSTMGLTYDEVLADLSNRTIIEPIRI